MVELLTGLSAVPVLLVVGGLVVAEAGLLIGVLLPGASGLLTLGFLTSVQVVSLPAAMVAMAIVAPLGPQLAYLTGRWRGAGRSCGQGWRGACGLLDRYGGPALAAGQFVVVTRTLTPRLAGVSGMPYRKFVRWNLPAAALWGAGWVLIGHVAGQAFERVGIGLALAGLILVGLVLLMPRHRRKPRTEVVLAASAVLDRETR
ncbi:membrane-associated protein/undecaprenyl-diphosphatase [Amycolatopsis marina]|uniref:Membrane-associated protein/undecaprenyl-diphosphatase n=1 Tax=Amycolatopsis marina TaxID=490629 RepID=A0A1I0XZY6_9PSEU|nr:hypothetical protein [Amycolatopsis marina]SFB05563.1 membrane-associated protein/undecaprenyl-diphosphatase [Amycolatopsis marina]